MPNLGPIIVDLQEFSLNSNEIELLQHPLVGGVVLFTRNYHSPEQLKSLTKAIRQLRSPELFVFVDHEGGPVQRFKEGFTILPPMQALGQQYHRAPEQALVAAEQLGYTMASELKACGVDISLAPVLDLDKGTSQVLANGRAIDADPKIVTIIANAYISGMHRAGMAATGKHFPGHGAVEMDSHQGLPIDQRSLQTIIGDDIKPFRVLMEHQLQAIMPAHIVFPAVDALPVSLSSIWLRGILREQLGFDGVVISDCLSMQGAVDSISDPVRRVQLALKAGCDFALICNNRSAVLQVLADLQPPENRRLAESAEKLRDFGVKR